MLRNSSYAQTEAHLLRTNTISVTTLMWARTEAINKDKLPQARTNTEQSQLPTPLLETSTYSAQMDKLRATSTQGMQARAANRTIARITKLTFQVLRMGLKLEITLLTSPTKPR